MINLLPPDTKRGYYYARRNTTLRKWASGLVVVLIGLGIIATYGLLTIHQSITSYNHQVASMNTKLQKENISQVKSQVKDISGSLQLAVKVLSKEVLFSKLLTEIGAAMPNGAVLTALNINETSGGLDLTAAATNYQTATQAQVNLSAASSKIFQKVDIISINCSANTNPGYPCAVQMRALFNADNQFLFINQGKSS